MALLGKQMAHPGSNGTGKEGWQYQAVSGTAKQCVAQPDSDKIVRQQMAWSGRDGTARQRCHKEAEMAQPSSAWHSTTTMSPVVRNGTTEQWMAQPVRGTTRQQMASPGSKYH